MSNLQSLLQQVRAEIASEFILTNIVGLDGIVVAEETLSPNNNSAATAARFALVVKLGVKITERLKLGAMEDNLVSTDEVFILSRFLGDGSFYWNLVLSREATLGYARLIMDEYADAIWSTLPR